MRPGPHEQPECQPVGVISTALFADFVDFVVSVDITRGGCMSKYQYALARLKEFARGDFALAHMIRRNGTKNATPAGILGIFGVAKNDPNLVRKAAEIEGISTVPKGLISSQRRKIAWEIRGDRKLRKH